MKKLKTTKPLLCLLLAGATITSISLLEGCSSRQDRYQELVAVANRNFNRLNYETAEEYYLKCIEILPKREEPYISLLEIYDQTAQPEKANEVLELAKENLSKESFELVEQEARELGQVFEEAEDEEYNKTQQEVEAKPMDPKMLEAYKTALNALQYQSYFPSGKEAKRVGDLTKPTEFAIVDINGNGVEELLIKYWGSASAHSLGYIGEHDPQTGLIKTVFTGTIDMIPYTGNILRVNAYRNQSFVREVWPFELYIWNETLSQYELVVSATGSYTDTSMKREADKDKDGLVLGIMRPDDSTESGMTPYDSEFMDEADLEAEVAAFAGDIRPIPVKFIELNDETLNSIGQETEKEENAPNFSAISYANLYLQSRDIDDYLYLYLDIEQSGKIVFEYQEYNPENWTARPKLVIFEGQLDDLETSDGPSYKAVIKDIARISGQFTKERGPEFSALANVEKTLNGSDVYVYPAGCKASAIPEKHLEIANRNRDSYMPLIGTEKYITETIVILDAEQAAFF